MCANRVSHAAWAVRSVGTRLDACFCGLHHLEWTVAVMDGYDSGLRSKLSAFIEPIDALLLPTIHLSRRLRSWFIISDE